MPTTIKTSLLVCATAIIIGASGPALAQTSLRPDRIETSGSIDFVSGSARISPASFAVLDQVARLMRDRPDIRIEVQAHSDSRGSGGFNLRMSQERATAIVAYLVQAGVPADHLTAQGFGETCPISSNRTAAGRAQNRRIFFFRLDSGLPRNCPIPPPPSPPTPDTYDQFPDPDDDARQLQ